MDDLSTYLQGDYRKELAERQRLKALAERVVSGVVATQQDGTWPYELRDTQPITLPKRYSYSTNAMVLHSLVAVAGPLRGSILVPGSEGWLVDGLLSSEELRKTFSRGVKVLDKRARTNKMTFSESATFGPDDPLTLGLILEIDGFLLEASSKFGPGAQLQQFDPRTRDKLWTRANAKLKLAIEDSHRAFDPRGRQDGEAAGFKLTTIDHSFPLLKVVHLGESLLRWQLRRTATLSPRSKIPDSQLARLEGEIRRWQRETAAKSFEQRLNRQLSYSQMPDSDFDAAELVLSLEGLILCSRTSPRRQLLRRVFQVLRDRQSESPYWKPYRPFLASSQGAILPPVSIEIANSLLRVCLLLDQQERTEDFLSNNLDLLFRYADWLISRVIVGETFINRKDQESRLPFCGWTSEHVGSESTIHLWETSQVLLFLSQYSGMLRKHIAKRGLDASRLQYEAHDPRGKGSDQGSTRRIPVGAWRLAADTKIKYWKDGVEKKEPLAGAPENSRYRVLSHINRYYVTPHAVPPTEGKRRYSVLLYGPPGTGKSSFAKDLSVALRYQFVTVTPSDFLAAGPADVERRAKELFEILAWQSDTVILFDEIDHFILDRESRLYRDQTGIFQFLTPGMLTKIKDLRSRRRPIFVIATNYEDRIDPAIKRLGRIDDQLPLLPPDSKQRGMILDAGLRKELEGIQTRTGRHIDAAEVTVAARAEIVERTRLWVFGEIIALVREATGMLFVQPEKTLEQLLLGILAEERIQPTITLRSYESRFQKPGNKRGATPEVNDFPTQQEPFEEFYLLLYLACEDSLAGGKTSLYRSNRERRLGEADLRVIRNVVCRELELRAESQQVLKNLERPPTETETQLAQSVRDPGARRKVLKVLWEVFQEGQEGT